MHQSLPTKLAFAVTDSGPNSAAGDYFTALELGAALTSRYGWQVTYLPEGAWYALEGVDIIVAMRDDFDPRCIVGGNKSLITVAWARNWFERWCDQPSIGDFSHILASSQLSARWMSERLGRLVHPLRIATNPKRFDNSQRSANPEFDFVFTGNYWGSSRDIAAAFPVLGEQYRGAVFGKNWQEIAELKPWYGGFVPYAELPEIYRNSTLVIDDANHVTKDWAAANSRVFDALAAGCLVITNSASVSEEVFAGDLPVYTDADELQRLVTHFLKDTAARERLLAHLRERVLKEHTYAQRAVAFRYLI